MHFAGTVNLFVLGYTHACNEPTLRPCTLVVLCENGDWLDCVRHNSMSYNKQDLSHCPSLSAVAKHDEHETNLKCESPDTDNPWRCHYTFSDFSLRVNVGVNEGYIDTNDVEFYASYNEPTSSSCILNVSCGSGDWLDCVRHNSTSYDKQDLSHCTSLSAVAKHDGHETNLNCESPDTDNPPWRCHHTFPDFLLQVNVYVEENGVDFLIGYNLTNTAFPPSEVYFYHRAVKYPPHHLCDMKSSPFRGFLVDTESQENNFIYRTAENNIFFAIKESSGESAPVLCGVKVDKILVLIFDKSALVEQIPYPSSSIDFTSTKPKLQYTHDGVTQTLLVDDASHSCTKITVTCDEDSLISCMQDGKMSSEVETTVDPACYFAALTLKGETTYLNCGPNSSDNKWKCHNDIPIARFHLNLDINGNDVKKSIIIHDDDKARQFVFHEGPLPEKPCQHDESVFRGSIQESGSDTRKLHKTLENNIFFFTEESDTGVQICKNDVKGVVTLLQFDKFGGVTEEQCSPQTNLLKFRCTIGNYTLSFKYK